MEQQHINSKRLGYCKIDLSQFLNLGVVTRTFPMDPNGQMYLTANISVVEVNEDSDISKMVLQSALHNEDNKDEESSDEGIVQGGVELMNNYLHFHQAIKPNMRQSITEQDDSENSSDDQDGCKLKIKGKFVKHVKDEAVNAIASAVGMNANIAKKMQQSVQQNMKLKEIENLEKLLQQEIIKHAHLKEDIDKQMSLIQKQNG